MNNFLKPIVKIFLLKPLSGITSQMVDIRQKMKYSFKLNLKFIFLLIKSTKKKVKVAAHTLLSLIWVLFFAGFMTLVPLFMYIKGFELIGIGPASMIFFLTPTAQFFLSIFYLGQPLEIEKLISFLFIWIAVIIYLNELRKEWNKIIIREVKRDIRKDIKSRFVLIKIEKLSMDIKFPTKILVSKFWLGKNNRPKIKPRIIE